MLRYISRLHPDPYGVTGSIEPPWLSPVHMSIRLLYPSRTADAETHESDQLQDLISICLMSVQATPCGCRLPLVLHVLEDAAARIPAQEYQPEASM